MADVEHKEINSKHAPNNHEVVVHRRELVSRLRVRGLSLREIVAALGREIINPKSGQPFTLITIQEDCKALDRQWLEHTAASTEEHKATVYARLQEIQRQGWQDKDMNIVLRALKQECDLLGLDAPAQYDILLRREAERVAEQTGMSKESVLIGVQNILAGKL